MRRLSFIGVLMIGAGLCARAADVPIVNPGFEDLVLPCVPGPTCGSSGALGWTVSGQVGTIKPTIGPGGYYPSGIPEGLNVGQLGSDAGVGIISQMLTATLQPNTIYTLVVLVGRRSDQLFPGYNVELLAGSTTVASDSSLTPPPGTFLTARIVYSSGPDPALRGQRLGIRLTGNARGLVNFDKISLDATPTIVSSSVSQIASGGGWKTTLTVVNLLPAQNTVGLRFRGDDGGPLALPLIITQQGISQPAMASSVDRTIEPGAQLLIESEAPSASATLVGWVEVISSGPVAGFAIFRQRGQNGRDSEGTAPLETSRSSSLMLPFDSTTGFSTGVALVNSTNQAVIVTATIRDDSGAQIGLQAVALPAMGHTSFAVTDRFSTTSGRRGIIEFQNTAGGAIAGLGLRFSSFGSFTSVPVTVR